MKSRVWLVVSATVIALALAGCASSGAEGNKTAVADGEIHWAIAGGNLENGHMDPHSSQSDISAVVARASLDSLTYLDAHGKLHPWLAKSWEVSDDERSVTFRLRDDVKFHDGTQLTAQAVKANFDHIMAKETKSAHANNLLGGDLYDGTDAVDSTTVRVKFTEPYAPFLNNSSSAFLGIYSPQAIKDSADKLATGGPKVTVGSGPWEMTELQAGSHIRYKRNSDYSWAPEGIEMGKKLANRLEISIVPDNQLRAESVSSGENQIASELSPASVDGRDDLQVKAEPSPGVPYSLFLNEKHGVLADKSVRQALQSGADINAAVESVYLGYFDQAKSLLTPTTPDITQGLVDSSYRYAPKQAEKLLDDAGWHRDSSTGIREKNGKKLKLSWISWTPRDDDEQTVADTLISDWKKIGIDVKNEVLEPGSYNERYKPGEYDIVDWSFASIDPDILRNHLSQDGYQNASHVFDPKIDKQLDAAAATFDTKKRTKAYDRLQEWNAKYVAILPLYSPAMISASNSDISGVNYDANNWPLFINARQMH
jgi:peptide/nickel transport system substrate-binding protein